MLKTEKNNSMHIVILASSTLLIATHFSPQKKGQCDN